LQSSRAILSDNSYGALASDLVNNNTNTKITLATNTKGKIYDGQKLALVFPNGSNLLNLTAAGDTETTRSVVNLVTFTNNITYPAGSLLIPLNYDFTNVITGGSSSSTPNLFRGINTSFIYIKPNDFNVTSHTTFSVYTRNNLGSVRPTVFQSRGKISASTFVPFGYKVTAVDIFASVNRNIALLEGQHQNDTVTSLATGTSNTQISLSTHYTAVDGRYLILQFELGSATDRIYGAKLTITTV
jgi:hypothetical protein